MSVLLIDIARDFSLGDAREGTLPPPVALPISLADKWEQTLLLAGEFTHRPEILHDALASPGSAAWLACPAGNPLAGAAHGAGLSLVELENPHNVSKVFWTLRRTVTRSAIRLVHCFDRESLFLCALLRRLYPIKVVHTVRAIPQDPGRLKHRLRNRAYRYADMLVFPGQNLADEFPAPIPPERKRVILPAFSKDHLHLAYRATAIHPPKNHFVFVCAADLTPEKDIMSLLQAMAYLQNMAIDLPSWEVRIVGDGPLFASLLAEAEKMGVAKRVALLGRQDRAALLDSADAVVCSSVAGAGDIPLILDAWHRAIPVACTALASHQALGNDKEVFLLSPPGKPIALAGSMLRMMTEPATREKIVRGGQAALAAYSPQGMAQAYAAIYKEVLTPALSEEKPTPVETSASHH